MSEIGKVVAGLSVSLDGFVAGPERRALAIRWVTAAADCSSGGRAGTERMRSRRPVPAARAQPGHGRGSVRGGRGHHWAAHVRHRARLGRPAPDGRTVLPADPQSARPVGVGPGTGGTVVTDGIESALKQAQAVADGRPIGVCAANVAQQYLRTGLLDEIHIGLVPVLLGGGVRLFAHPADKRLDLECTRVVESDGVTHLSYRVLK